MLFKFVANNAITWLDIYYYVISMIWYERFEDVKSSKPVVMLIA